MKNHDLWHAVFNFLVLYLTIVCMERKIYNSLLSWRKTARERSALLIQGAHRVGKSYIAEEFARREYKSYILIDFNKASSDIKELFEFYLDDLDTFFMKLKAYYNTPLYEKESLIIFDEVQLFPRARSAIKYLVEDGRYDYIETGSLISIKEHVKDILIPSEEDSINMYPMDFEEFLTAGGYGEMLSLIRSSFEKKHPLGQALHRKAMDLFRQYLIVGGMPQAVDSYFNRSDRDFQLVDREKRRILKLYREDIRKHSGRYAIKTEAVFDEIPSQLKNQNRHFMLSAIEKGASFDDYQDAIFWLTDAMIINPCFNTTEPNVGLNLNRERSLLKCYLADTGLLISHIFDEKQIVSEEIYKKILFGKLEVNLGMVMENIVAQMLTSAGHKLYFYANSSRDDASSRMEIDFLIAKDRISNRHNISPLEVKSSKNYTLSSLNKFRKKYSEVLHVPYVIHTEDYREDGGVIYIPVYMTYLL